MYRLTDVVSKFGFLFEAKVLHKVRKVMCVTNKEIYKVDIFEYWDLQDKMRL